MATVRDPFDVLGVSPVAEPAAIAAAYRAAARRYHPDHAGGQSTSKMQEVNWARDELARDLAGWRTRVLRARGSRAVSIRPRSGGTENASTTLRGEPIQDTLLDWVEVDPQVLLISGVVGARAVFRARAFPQRPSAIRARVRSDSPVDIARLNETQDTVTFSVEVVSLPAFESDDSLIVPIEVRSDGFSPNTVFISIQPLTSSVVAQVYRQERIAPARHASATARIHFGKHKGRTYAEIALEDPGYLEWMLREHVDSVIARECARLALGYGPDKVLGSPLRSASRRQIETPKRRLQRRNERAVQPPNTAPPPRLVSGEPSKGGLLAFFRGLLGPG